MKKFLINVVAMFIPSRKIRGSVRKKLKTKLLRKEREQEYLLLKSEWRKHYFEPLIPGRFEKYDLFFSIGATCHGTRFLDMFHLRRFSTPFEWSAGRVPEDWFVKPGVERDSRFREKIDALCNNFENFFIPTDFCLVCDSYSATAAHHHVVNMRTNIRFQHAFPMNESIENFMPEFIKKMERRRARLYKALECSDKICIIWLNRCWTQRAMLDKPVSDEDIIYAVKKLGDLYPNKQIDLIFFEHDGSKKRFEFDKIPIAPNAFRIKSNHYLIDDQYAAIYDTGSPIRRHVHLISEMLDNIKLSNNAYSISKDD